MLFQPRIQNGFHLGVARKMLGDPHRVFGSPFVANRQGAHSTQKQPRLKRARNAPSLGRRVRIFCRTASGRVLSTKSNPMLRFSEIRTSHSFSP